MLATLLGLSVWTAPAGSAAVTGTATYKVWHWNIAGHALNFGATDNGLVDAILGSLSYRDPDFISLNEICPDQYRAILKGLQDANWPQSPSNFARFEPMPDVDADLCKSDNGGPDTDPYGVAVFSKFAPSGTDRITLPSDGDKARKLLCVPITSQPGGLRFCTTHITFKNAYKQAQLDTVRTKMEQFTAAGGTVITAGDFNVQPHDPLLDNWYAQSATSSNNANNSGIFREFDDLDPLCPGWGEQTTEGTLAGLCGQPAKVDHVFAAESRLVSYDADTHPIARNRCLNRSHTEYIACSDHRIVTATVTVTAP
ncbi:endonuclease/exonuclease/phosphatase family protein [Streptomyces sp. ISL-36]|uniref:endonuclease/exonuclease/phosphatase family protein n=1 Tax=Streptomyces sp. ISL-36 TaxID=2819182 RepID=UPI001BE6561B|nr:endonuclease/exonuclease/phosphatase family protein [Streptomyces sp. ISL-36]MBT2444773.1 endonuclease/exonuclease/phosphatase family protein [Streptomyces sp. ISL-36]